MKYLWICTLIGAALTASGISRGNTLQTIVGLVLVLVGFAPLVRRLVQNVKKQKAEKAYKEYKRVHKRKIITDFHVYVKPEEGAAYYTVNGEGAEEFKIDLT